MCSVFSPGVVADTAKLAALQDTKTATVAATLDQVHATIRRIEQKKRQREASLRRPTERDGLASKRRKTEAASGSSGALPSALRCRVRTLAWACD